MIGLLFAFGEYDIKLAKLFLGIEGDEYRNGGRLENYVPEGVTSFSIEHVLLYRYLRIIRDTEDR